MCHSVFLLGTTETAALENGASRWRANQMPESRLFPQSRQDLDLRRRMNIHEKYARACFGKGWAAGFVLLGNLVSQCRVQPM